MVLEEQKQGSGSDPPDHKARTVQTTATMKSNPSGPYPCHKLFLVQLHKAWKIIHISKFQKFQKKHKEELITLGKSRGQRFCPGQGSDPVPPSSHPVVIQE